MKVNPSSLALVALMCISTDARRYFDPVTGPSTFPVDLAEESWEAKFARHAPTHAALRKDFINLQLAQSGSNDPDAQEGIMTGMMGAADADGMSGLDSANDTDTASLWEKMKKAFTNRNVSSLVRDDITVQPVSVLEIGAMNVGLVKDIVDKAKNAVTAIPSLLLDADQLDEVKHTVSEFKKKMKENVGIKMADRLLSGTVLKTVSSPQPQLLVIVTQLQYTLRQLQHTQAAAAHTGSCSTAYNTHYDSFGRSRVFL